MKENLTEIAFILDRSGSMDAMCQEAIGGFNGFLEKQQKEPGEAKLSLVLFDHEYDPVVTDATPANMPPLTQKSYVPRGTTALLDAMGRTIDDLGKRLAALPEAERPETVIVVTLTDGLENASQDYTKDKVTEMIRHQQKVYGWEFLFLGADLDSVSYARDLGVPRQNSMRYDSVGESMSLSHQFISERRRRKKVQN